MRVLITTDTVGGVWSYTTTLAHALADRFDSQVLIVAIGPLPAADQCATLTLGARPAGGSVEFEYLPIPLEWEDADELAYESGRQALLQLALGWRAHVLHANEHHLGLIGATGLPVLVVSHSDLCAWHASMDNDPYASVGVAYRQRVIDGLNSAALVVAPSTAVADALNAWYGYSGVVRVIPNGVSPAVQVLAPARTIDAMMACRLWDPAKNLQCFREAIAGFERGTFIAAGPLSPPGAPPITAEDRLITYPGRLDNAALRTMLARARILVSPARYEPFGLVAVEAALAGCCLLLADIPTYRAIWDRAALYFDPGDATALRTLIHGMLDEPDRRHALGEAARVQAESRFTAERMARAYMRTYQRLVLRYGIAF